MNILLWEQLVIQHEKCTHLCQTLVTFTWQEIWVRAKCWTWSILSREKIIVCGGDAEYAMHLGGITTAARYTSNLKGKLIYIVFDNESNKSTGGQKAIKNT